MRVLGLLGWTQRPARQQPAHARLRSSFELGAPGDLPEGSLAVATFPFMEHQVKQELVDSESKIEKSRNDITSVSETVSASVAALVDFEDRFGEKLGRGKESLGSANRESSESVNEIATEIHALSDLAAAERQKTLSTVNKILG